jgi:serine/threonine protein kinase
MRREAHASRPPSLRLESDHCYGDSSRSYERRRVRVQAQREISFQAGTLFHGRYRVVRCIKSGGMGAVYEATDDKTSGPRALKVMLPDLLDNEGLRARFALEARITGGIESDHIVRTFDAGVDEATGVPFLVMELLRGEDLGALLKRRKNLAPGDVAPFLLQAARALDKTHAAGIVHRDLKPDNLFLTVRDDGSPCVKILDFGIAKVTASQDPLIKTRPMMGTPLYMSPEQVRNERTIGPAADIYALGHIAYTLLVGESYWAEEADNIPSPYLLISEIMRGPQEPPSARAPRRRSVALPTALDGWFLQATALAAENRFPCASDAIFALGEALSVPLSRARPPLLFTLDGEGYAPPPAEEAPSDGPTNDLSRPGALQGGAVATVPTDSIEFQAALRTVVRGTRELTPHDIIGVSDPSVVPAAERSHLQITRESEEALAMSGEAGRSATRRGGTPQIPVYDRASSADARDRTPPIASVASLASPRDRTPPSSAGSGPGPEPSSSTAPRKQVPAPRASSPELRHTPDLGLPRLSSLSTSSRDRATGAPATGEPSSRSKVPPARPSSVPTPARPPPHPSSRPSAQTREGSVVKTPTYRFQITSDLSRCILKLRVWGFWTIDEAKAYWNEFQNKARPLLDKPWYVLADIADFPPQKAEVNELLEKPMVFARERGMVRAANLVTSSALSKMLISRLSTGTGLSHSFFSSEAEALEWLLQD